jgi:hypothetical protein
MAKPKCLSSGFSFAPFEIGSVPPYIQLAGVTLKNCPIPVKVGALSVFSVGKPEVDGAPYQISATFFNASGKLSLILEKNEWRVMSDQWDAVVQGGRILIHSAPREPALILRFDPGYGIIVEKLDMFLMGYRLRGDADTLLVIGPAGNTLTFTGCVADNCAVGLSLG